MPFITPSTNRPGGRRARPRRSSREGARWTSTARPPRALKGGSTLDPFGYDAGKRTLGRKRHILTDTLGLLLGVVIHPADIQDPGGAEPLLRQACRQFTFIERIIGDAGYQGPKMAAAVARAGPWQVQIIRCCDQHRFVVLPKRWIVERTIG